jgi:hypothetical protein
MVADDLVDGRPLANLRDVLVADPARHAQSLRSADKPSVRLHNRYVGQ